MRVIHIDGSRVHILIYRGIRIYIHVHTNLTVYSALCSANDVVPYVHISQSVSQSVKSCHVMPLFPLFPSWRLAPEGNIRACRVYAYMYICTLLYPLEYFTSRPKIRGFSSAVGAYILICHVESIYSTLLYSTESVYIQYVIISLH